MISCNPDQNGAVEARMMVNEGVVDVNAAEEVDNEDSGAEDEGSIGGTRQINTGCYKL